MREARESFTDVSFEEPQGCLEGAVADIQAEIPDPFAQRVAAGGQTADA